MASTLSDLSTVAPESRPASRSDPNRRRHCLTGRSGIGDPLQIETLERDLRPRGRSGTPRRKGPRSRSPLARAATPAGRLVAPRSARLGWGAGVGSRTPARSPRGGHVPRRRRPDARADTKRGSRSVLPPHAAACPPVHCCLTRCRSMPSDRSSSSSRMPPSPRAWRPRSCRSSSAGVSRSTSARLAPAGAGVADGR